MSVRILLLTGILLLASTTGSAAPPEVRVTRVPEGGVQPLAAVGSDGAVHLVYFKGQAKAGDLFYGRREKGAADFSAPVRVNSEAGSAAAIGTIRGGQMALGKDDRVHVAWNGSGRRADGTTDHEHCPVMYTRWDTASKAFEPERNLMTCTTLLDGGCTVAADTFGRVTVAWHAAAADSKDHNEESRRVYFAQSSDEGKTFAQERPAHERAGVCACCGMTGFAAGCGQVFLVYRGAHQGSERGMVLLRGECADKEQDVVFTRVPLQDWRIQACPMSSAAIGGQPSEFGLIDPRLAWETDGQVWLATCSSVGGKLTTPVAAPRQSGDEKKRKHPRVCVNRKGETLLVWTEGTGWNKGGSLAWQVFDAQNRPIDGAIGKREGVPAWSFAAAVALPGGGFEILY